MYCISSLKVARLAITVVEINSVTVFQVHDLEFEIAAGIASQNFSRILQQVQ